MGIVELVGASIACWLAWGTDLFWSRTLRESVNQHPDEWHFPRWFVRFYGR